jgi:hypothetical protein
MKRGASRRIHSSYRRPGVGAQAWVSPLALVPERSCDLSVAEAPPLRLADIGQAQRELSYPHHVRRLDVLLQAAAMMEAATP